MVSLHPFVVLGQPAVLDQVPLDSVNIGSNYVLVARKVAPGGLVLVRWGNSEGHAAALIQVVDRDGAAIEQLTIFNFPWPDDVYRKAGVERRPMTGKTVAGFPARQIDALLNSNELRPAIWQSLRESGPLDVFGLWSGENVWLRPAIAPSPVVKEKHAEVDPDFLATVSANYLWAVSQQQWPVNYIYSQVKSSGYTKATVRMWVDQARAAKLLPPANRQKKSKGEK